MTNIYASPLASPSFECLSTVEETQQNQLTITGEEIKQDFQNRDENENVVFENATKTSTKIKAYDFKTPSGTITTLNVSAGTRDSGSPKKSPVYCFHSFTYGVGGSNENVAGLQDGEKTALEQNGSTVQEDESFDADSPNVWHTRTVVDPDPDESGSPTILCEWNMGETAESLTNDSLSSKESSVTESSKAFQSEICVDIQNPEADNQNSAEEKATDDSSTPPSAQENENSTEGSSTDVPKTLVRRRLSPEGAECLAVNTQMSDPVGNTACYLTVPDKRVVSIQRRDFMGSASPSGRMEVTDYWMWDDTIEGKEVVDYNHEDREPLIEPEKSHTKYTEEKGLEEVDEGVPVTCFPCRHCAIL